MASLVLGGIGGYLFGPIGFAVGSALGNLIDPQRMEGPRIQDKHLQGSSYGEPIPLAYGTIRLAGQVIWTTDLKEHKNDSGGKGGPSITTYTYSASFDVLLCEAPVEGVLRIWADGTLIYDATGNAATNNESLPITIYVGGAGQQPDPTEEAELGVGNVPAYLGVCRVVFDDWDLGMWGNRIPQLTFEVYTKGGPIPWRYSSFSPFENQTTNWDTASATYEDGAIFASDSSAGLSPTLKLNIYELNGTQIGDTYEQTLMGYQFEGAIANLNCFMATINQDGNFVSYWWYYRRDSLEFVPVMANWTGPLGPYMNGSRGIYKDGYIYTIGNDSLDVFITRWYAPNGVPGERSAAPQFLAQGGPANFILFDTNEAGYFYVATGTVSGKIMWKFDLDLNVVKYWSQAETNGTNLEFMTAVPSAYVYNDIMAFSRTNPAGLGYVIALVKIAQDYTLSNHGTTIPHADAKSIMLQGGLVLDADGVYSLYPPPEAIQLWEIVGDISARVGLAPSQYDVTALTQIVPGFLVSRQSTGRDNIMQLRSAYFFDGVESSGCEKFVNRGGASIVTIPQNHLAAQYPSKGNGPAILTVKRGQEVDLPATMWVVYFNMYADYQNGTQYARRIVTQSQANARVDLAIALSDEMAVAIANKLLYQTWVERTQATALTAIAYLWYEPTDVITANGYTLRITDKKVTQRGIVQFDGVQTAGSLYIAQPSPTPGQGQNNPPVLLPRLPTDLILLDVPLAVDTDPDASAYAPMASQGGEGTWPGGIIYKSIDDATFNNVATSTTACVMGTVDTALGPFYGGNMVDEINSFEVTVGVGGGEMASCSLDALYGGANLMLVGLEYVQAMRRELIAPGRYLCSGLLRGRRGTEWAMQGHSAGEPFYNYPFIYFAMALSELALERYYKGVTLNTSPALVDSIPFTSYGQAIRPYAPVLLGGGVNGSGDVTLTWTRRTRRGGAWIDFNDVPLSEPSELFVVQIWDAAYTVCARVITGISTESTVYTAAQQIADFGSTQEHIYWTVGQVGTYTLGFQAQGVAPGAGSGDDAPLSPAPPYNSSPAPTTTINVSLSYPSDNEVTTDFNIGDTVVASFTVGGSPPTSGYVSTANSNPPAYGQRIRLCADAAGTTVLAEAYGNPVATVPITAGMLSASTTYYVIVTSQLPSNDPSGVPGTLANIAVTLLAT